MTSDWDGTMLVDCKRCGAPTRVPYRDYKGEDKHTCWDCTSHDSPPKDGYESTTFTLDEEKKPDEK